MLKRKIYLLQKIVYVLVIVGGINWGLYGISRLNLVELFFGTIPMVANIIYVLIGLAALYSLLLLLKPKKTCTCTTSPCVCDDDTKEVEMNI